MYSLFQLQTNKIHFPITICKHMHGQPFLIRVALQISINGNTVIFYILKFETYQRKKSHDV